MKFFPLLIILLLFASAGLTTGQDLPNTKNEKKKRVADSLFVSDSTNVAGSKQAKIPDSLLSIPLTSHGKLFQGDYKPFRAINKKEIQLINYTGLNDIIMRFTPFYNRNLGTYASFNSFNAFGVESKGISWGFNGRNINDLPLGSLNPEQFPAEFFENIEIFTGSDAVIFGDNASSVFINIQEIRYNTAKPFTRLWFGNSGFGYLGADGIFSQNVMPNVNFTFGFRSYAANGAYQNSWSGNWNVRLLLRWNPDNRTSISLTENFSNLGTGISGGINTQLSENVFDRIASVPNFTGLKDRLFRHDLTLSATRKFDTTNTNAASLNLYYSTVEHNRSSGANLQFNEADTVRRIYSDSYQYLGAECRYEVELFDAIAFRFGGISELNFIDKTFLYDEFNGLSTAAYAHSEIDFTERISLSGGVRLFTKFGNVGIAYGAKQTTILSKNLSFILDASYSDRLPFPVEGLSLKNEQNLALNSELVYHTDENNYFIIGGFIRTVFSPILAEINGDITSYKILNHYNGNNLTRSGAYAEYSSDIFNSITIRIRGLFQLGVDDSGSRLEDLPLFNGSVRMFYTYSPGKSMMRLGIESGLLSDFRGDNFLPLTRSYYPGNYHSGFMLTGIDAFAEVRLGSANVKLQMQNILSQKYYFVAVNPMMPVNFRLTVNWTFNE